MARQNIGLTMLSRHALEEFGLDNRQQHGLSQVDLG